MPLFKSVNLTSPGPIGSTTPNTGAFTTLSATGVLTSTSINAATAGYILNGSNASFLFNNRSRILCPSDGDIQFANNAQTASIILSVESTNILAQRNSTNAQTFRIYNTYTDASNYERGFMRWATNVLEIGAEAAGTGTQRQLRFPLGTVTASTPLSITQTWNASAIQFSAIKIDITNTASNANSFLLDCNVDGSRVFSVNRASTLFISSASDGPVINNGNGGIGINRRDTSTTSAAVYLGSYAGQSLVTVLNSGRIGFSSASSDCSGGYSLQDTYISRDSAGVLALRNSTNAQAFKLYRTFTDASNYERLGFLATNTTRYTITSENAGTGSARSLEVSFYTAASDPTSTDITSGCFSVWKNSGTGIVKLWVNDGGTMKSVALV
jgi:hypothetical protein